MTRETATSLRTDSEGTEMVYNFCFLGLTVNIKETNSQEIDHGLALGQKNKEGVGKDSEIL